MATQMKKFKIPLTILFGILHILIVKNRDMVTFTVPENPRFYIYGIIGLAVVFCFLFYHLFFTVLQKLLTHDRKFWSYFKYFLGYFAFMGFFWLITWPGIFKGDEFYVIQAPKTLRFPADNQD